MAQLILFGRQDSGGFFRDPNGRVHRVPPLEPALFSYVQGVGALAQARQAVADKGVAKELEPLLAKVTDLMIGQLEKVVGSIDKGSSIDKDAGIVFADVEGGFICGSTGLPPVPIPHVDPPRRSLD